jgi:hypothetical protein
MKLGITYGYSIDLDAPLGVQVVSSDDTTPLRADDWVVARAATLEEVSTLPERPFLVGGLSLDEITSLLQSAVALGVIRPPGGWNGADGAVDDWEEIAVCHHEGEWVSLPLPRGVLPPPR